MRGAWSGWAERLVIVKPETVVKLAPRALSALLERALPTPGVVQVGRESIREIRRLDPQDGSGERLGSSANSR